MFNMLAYIDPGIISLAVQALFAAIFGAATVFLLGPRRWLVAIWRRLFSRSRRKPQVSTAAPSTTEDQQDSASPGLRKDP